MAVPGFYDQNSDRAYPFVASGAQTGTIYTSEAVARATDIPFPRSCVVDCGALLGLGVEYSDTEDQIFLYAVTRTEETLLFEFRSTATTLADYRWQFTRHTTDGEYTTDAQAATTTGVAVPSLACDELPPWEGFLSTGALGPLFELLETGETFLADEQALVLEPALIQNLDRSFVRSINLANADRTRVTLPEACEDSEDSLGDTEDVVFINSLCLTGALRLRPGYNCRIRQDSRNRELSIAAAAGSGAGEPCEEVPLYPDEVPDPGETLLTGGPECGDLIKTIAGVGGRAIRIVAGTGVSITQVSEHHLKISADMHDLQVCATD